MGEHPEISDPSEDAAWSDAKAESSGEVRADPVFWSYGGCEGGSPCKSQFCFGKARKDLHQMGHLLDPGEAEDDHLQEPVQKGHPGAEEPPNFDSIVHISSEADGGGGRG